MTSTRGDGRFTLPGMNRSRAIAEVAELVLARDQEDDVWDELPQRFPATDQHQVEVLAACVMFVKEEVGEDAVRRIRDRHARAAA